MRLSKLHIVTLRDDPADAELPSHRLLARADYRQKLAEGIAAGILEMLGNGAYAAAGR